MISKNFTKYFQIPLYWLILLVFFFLVSSLIPMLTGYFVSLLTSGTDKHEVFRIFGPNFPRLMSFLSSLAFSIALSLFLGVFVAGGMAFYWTAQATPDATKSSAYFVNFNPNWCNYRLGEHDCSAQIRCIRE